MFRIEFASTDLGSVCLVRSPFGRGINCTHATMTVGRNFLSSKRALIFFVLTGLFAIIHVHNEVSHVSPVKESSFLPLDKRWFENRHGRGHGKRYLNSRILHHVSGTSTFQLDRIIRLCGDVHPHPGPASKVKYPCKECSKNVRSNQNAILCAQCETWSHAKCIGFTTNEFKYYLDNPNIDWICNWCCLPFSSQKFALEEEIDLLANKTTNSNEFQVEDANKEEMERPVGDVLSQIISSRQKNSRNLLMMHLNINSVQNKFEELKLLVDRLKAHVIFLTETKIDSSYTNSQFNLDGFNLYRNDRRKGGGGIMAYFSSSLKSRKLKPPRKYSTFETLIIKSKFGNNEAVVVGMYRPPKAVGSDYYIKLENDLNDIVSWAALQTNFVVLTGDLNLDRLKPELKEGKILCDLEEVHGLTCLITNPTRITENSQTLLDVILTNKPELFKESHVYDPGISDHAMVIGIMAGNAVYHPRKVVTFRNLNKIEEDIFR